MADLVKIGNWYQQLIEDLQILNFRGIVQTKHAIGKRIIEDELKFGKPKYGNHTIENLAKDLDIEQSDLYRCIQFAEKYPEISDTVRKLSWRRIIHKLLPESPHISRSTGDNEWDTPPEFIQSARVVMGNIDVDPASNEEANEIIQADRFYTTEDNGLDKSWNGNIWLNPPYSQPLITEFSKTLVEKYESQEIKQACVLINNATETTWFQGMLELCKCVCFPKGRIKFIDKLGNPSGAPLQGQAILYFGENENLFSQEFSKYGLILWRK